MLQGSLTPEQIEWDIALADGYQLHAKWWHLYGERDVVAAGFKKQSRANRLRG